MYLLNELLSITIIDLALSGDNAAVIGLTVRNLPPRQRKVAAFLGAAGAILVRVLFTALATVLITVPYLSALGGIILVWITWRLVVQKKEDNNMNVSNRFWTAVFSIIVADLSMAFDNVLGVAGAAHGDLKLMIFGLALSIPILIVGANWLATIMHKYPITVYIGAAVLANTAFKLVLHDPALSISQYIGAAAIDVLPKVFALLVLAWGWLYTCRFKTL